MSSAAETAPLTTMASAIFFGTITFAATALATKSLISGDFRAVEAAKNPRSSALDTKSFTSIYTLLHHVTIFGAIMLYAYICEYHPPFPHAGKSYDRDEFFFLTFLLIVVSLFTLKPNDPAAAAAAAAANKNGKPTMVRGFPSDTQADDATAVTKTRKDVAPVNDHTEVLNRDQTEEWKGWMQFMFLLYHYYHAEEVYNSIRIMITCYVWMTGFGNFSFFYLKADYGSVRVMQMLWRLNFLVLFLCLTQGTTYILYYICLLHTYFFLMVYVSMRIAKNLNYNKWGIRLKLTVLAVIIYFVWDVDSGIFRLMHWPFLGETPMQGANSGSMWEWYFRSSLDHWSTFLGMIFALNFRITSLFFRKLEAQPVLSHVAAKLAMAVALGGAFYLWVTGPFMKAKLEYNATNAYYGCIPLIAYIYFRNVTPWLRSHSLDLLHQIGKTTLETYLMQHHIWLTSDAKSLLTLIPGWPKVNFLVVTCLYFFLSRRLYQLTLFLRGMVLPNDRNACLRNLLGMAAAICLSVLTALTLRLLGMLNLLSVGVCAIGFGSMLCQAILDNTWRTFADSKSCVEGESSSESKSSPNTQAAKGKAAVEALSPAVGVLSILVLGLLWNHMSQVGAAKIQPLSNECEDLVQHGAWIPVDGCNEESRGVGYRQHGAQALGTCSVTPADTWGWDSNPPSSH